MVMGSAPNGIILLQQVANAYRSAYEAKGNTGQFAKLRCSIDRLDGVVLEQPADHNDGAIIPELQAPAVAMKPAALLLTALELLCQLRHQSLGPAQLPQQFLR